MSQTSQSCREHAQECRELARTMWREDQRRDMQVIVNAWEEAAAAKDARETRSKGAAATQVAKEDESLCTGL